MTEEQVCRNCGNNFSGKYCNICGQKVFHPKDKRLVHLFEETVHFLTHFEGSFLTNLKTIIRHPGKFSDDYCNGRRKRYYKPISFFLILVILYLLFPVFEGLNMQLQYFRSNGLFNTYYNGKITAVMSEKGMTFDELSAAFHQRGERIAKFLLFSIIPVMAVVSKLLTYKIKRFYYDHFIFSTEVLSFFILWAFLFLPLLMIIVKFLTGWNLFTGEQLLGVIILTVFLIYMVIAAKQFFHFGWWKSIAYNIVWIAFFTFYMQFIYKFILFYLAINSV